MLSRNPHAPVLSRLAVVGNIDSTPFRDLRAFISQNPHRIRLSEFGSLSDLLNGSQGASHRFDIVVVLQSWPDEYASNEISRLIGHLTATRIFCCFSAWCQSDGRTRDLWPPLMRVPSESAVPLIRQELAETALGIPSMPATAAAEEVFTHRLFDGRIFSRSSRRSHSGMVISSDSALRRTVQQMLAAFGISPTAAGVTVDAFQPVPAFRPVPVADKIADPFERRPESRRSSTRATHIEIQPAWQPDMVIQDLDEPCRGVQDSLETIRKRWPAAAVIGMAAFRSQDLSRSTSSDRLHSAVRQLIVKDDILLGLTKCIKLLENP